MWVSFFLVGGVLFFCFENIYIIYKKYFKDVSREFVLSYFFAILSFRAFWFRNMHRHDGSILFVKPGQQNLFKRDFERGTEPTARVTYARW